MLNFIATTYVALSYLNFHNYSVYKISDSNVVVWFTVKMITMIKFLATVLNAAGTASPCYPIELYLLGRLL